MEVSLKNVLMIAYSFPPAGGPGVQRTSKFVKYLRHYGWEPVVLTRDTIKMPLRDESLGKDIPDNIRIIRTKAWDLTSGSRIMGLIGKFISRKLLIPDSERLWEIFSRKEAGRVIESHNIRLIYTTSLPYSSHLMAIHLKEKYHHIPWVADFRDEWTNNPYILDNPHNLIRMSIERKMEKRVLETADYLITNTPIMLKNFIENNLDIANLKDRFFVIPNGYDPDDFKHIDLGVSSELLPDLPPGLSSESTCQSDTIQDIKQYQYQKQHQDQRQHQCQHQYQHKYQEQEQKQEQEQHQDQRQHQCQHQYQHKYQEQEQEQKQEQEQRKEQNKGQEEKQYMLQNKDQNKCCDSFTITYTGSFYGRRKPDMFFNALSELIAENKINKDNIHVKLIGNFKTEQLKQLLKEYDLEGVVGILPYMDHDQCIVNMAASDCLLLIEGAGPGSEAFYTGKVFEYMVSGRPILAIIPQHGAAAQLIKETKTGLISDCTDLEATKKNIENLYTSWLKNIHNYSPDKEEIKKYERNTLAMELAKVFDKALSLKSR